MSIDLEYKKKTKRLVIELAPNEHSAIKTVASAKGVTIREMVMEALRDKFELRDILKHAKVPLTKECLNDSLGL